MWKNAILLDKGKEFSDFQTYDLRFNSPFITDSGNPEIKLLLQYVDQITIGHKNLDYFTPNNVAIFFSLAKRSIIIAKNLLSKIENRIKTESKGSLYDEEVLISNSKLTCDYLEQIQSAIVFSFTAIESFSNISIPPEYVFKLKTNRKTEIYSKEQIERWVSWKDKISKILVDIYNVDKIEHQPFWKRFLDLVELRDKIIHQKSTSDTEYMEQLFDDKIFEICHSSNQVFQFFLSKSLERFVSNTEMVGNERLWPRIITYIPDMPIALRTRRFSGEK